MSPLERVLARTVPGPGACVIWTGYRNRSGYGVLEYADAPGRRFRGYVHRVVYEAMRGLIPADLVVDHLCCTPLCVNPHHLELVTRAENARRGSPKKGARADRCPQGHEWTEANIYRRPDNGKRVCRACTRARLQEAS